MTSQTPAPLDANAMAALFRRIVELHQAGQEAESLPLCEQLIATGIVSGGLFNLAALAALKAKQLDKALELAQKAVALSPRDGEVHNTLGLVEKERGFLARSLLHYIDGLAVTPQSYNLLVNAGQVYALLRGFPESETSIRKAISLDPTRAVGYESLVFLRRIQGDLAGARVAQDELIARFGLTPERWGVRLDLCRMSGDWDSVEQHLAYGGPGALNADQEMFAGQMAGMVLLARGRYDELHALIDKVKASGSQQAVRWLYVEAQYHLARGDKEASEALMRRYVQAVPDDHAVHYELGHLQVSMGKIEEGFVNSEARWDLPFFTSGRRVFKQKRWTGQNLRGREILLWGEQGIGDEIRYATGFNDLRYRGARITLETAPKLIPFFKRAFPWMTVRDNGDFDARDNPEYNRFDYQCPTGSLHQHLRHSVEDFFAQQKPYYKVTPEERAQVRARAGIGNDGPMLVGLSWRSSLRELERSQQAWRVEDMAPLIAQPGIRWLCVQYDDCRAEVATLRQMGMDIVHFEEINQKDDLVAAAALMGGCDMVVTAATAVSEIAAVANVPTVQFAGEGGLCNLGLIDSVPWHPYMKCYSFAINQPLDAMARIVADFDGLKDWARQRAVQAER